jgi:hypothetical protein
MKKFYLYLLAAFTVQLSWAQSIFDNPITNANPSASNPFTSGQTVDPNLTVSGIGRGSGISGSGAANRYSASGWTTAATSDPSDYFEFILTPNAAFKINFVSFVYTGQASGTGPTAVAFRSSVDGFTGDIGTPSIGGTTVDLSAAAFQNVNASITFRFYAFNASAAGGTFSINDFTFNGTVVPILLPVNIASFGGYRQGGRNLLQWTTAAESNNSGFEVQRAADGIHFTTIATVPSLAPGGNSTAPLSYSFADANVPAGKQLYRLRQLDLNGQGKLSSVVIIRGDKALGLAVDGIFPNPVQDITSMLVVAPQRGWVTLVANDIDGRTVGTRLVQVETGNNTVQWNIGHLSAGLYTLRAIDAAGQVSAPVRLVKQ